MKKIFLPAVLIAATLLTASCTKQYNEKPIGQNGGGGINDGSDPNDNTNWNWSGTAPLSAKYDGRTFLADSIEVVTNSGITAIYGKMTSNNTLMMITMSANAVPGRVYPMPAAGGSSFQSLTPLFVTQSATGKIKIIKNNATTLEGYFWANMVNIPQEPDTAIAVTEGYFKVTK